jgi:hypothetical protein
MLTTELQSCIRFNTDGTMTLCVSLPDAFFRFILSNPELDLILSHADVLDTMKRALSDPDLTDAQKIQIGEML